MAESIYAEIWASDLNRLTVSSREGESWTDTTADILLDEQARAHGSRTIDLATRPLFHAVKENKLHRGTYPAFERLLDNFAVNFRDPEEYSPQEGEEIDSFLLQVIDSEPMRLARSYVTRVLQPGLTVAGFRAALRRMWFDIYTNHYRGRSTHYCSGFEHVFVGEGKFDRRRGAAASKGEISGYHSWLKFYRDEDGGRVNYLGYKYDLGAAGGGPANPHVVTLQMIWNHIDLRGRLRAQLFKKKGGFFVGASPECEMAMATVAFYESQAGLLTNQRKRVHLADQRYDLVLYRSTLPDGAPGQHIRSFYPVYLGADGATFDGGDDDTDVHPVDPGTVNNGPVVIHAAQPNPPGDDSSGEWVEIANQSRDRVDLTEWELRDRVGRPRPLAGTLEAGAIERFAIPRDTEFGMMLANRRGVITLHDPHGRLAAAVSYGKAEEDAVIAFR